MASLVDRMVEPVIVELRETNLGNGDDVHSGIISQSSSTGSCAQRDFIVARESKRLFPDQLFSQEEIDADYK